MKKLIISVIALSLVSFLGASASAAMPVTHLNRLHVIQDLQCATITATTANYSVVGTVTAGVNVVAPAATITVVNATTGNITHVVASTVVGALTGASAGIHTGAVVGNVTGNVVGNVVGNVTGNIVGNSTGTHTGAVVGNISTTVVTFNNVAYTAQAVTIDGVLLNVLGALR